MALSKVIEVIDRITNPKPKYIDFEDRSYLKYKHHQRNSDFVLNIRNKVKFIKERLCFDCIRLNSQYEIYNKIV